MLAVSELIDAFDDLGKELANVLVDRWWRGDLLCRTMCGYLFEGVSQEDRVADFTDA